ncbi:MAG: outer membrane lipoprotein carrier protein LolA [Burkholderiales bacterium]
MHDLAQVRSAKARFVERKELAVLNSPLELSGILIYTAPGRLEKHTLKPRLESLVLDEKTLRIEDKAKGRSRTIMLEEQPVLWAFVESIRATLAGDLKRLHRFYDVDLRGEERNWHLTLKPRDRRLQTVVDEIDIGGSRNQVRTIEIHERHGDRSLMTITDVTQ